MTGVTACASAHSGVKNTTKGVTDAGGKSRSSSTPKEITQTAQSSLKCTASASWALARTGLSNWLNATSITKMNCLLVLSTWLTPCLRQTVTALAEQDTDIRSHLTGQARLFVPVRKVHRRWTVPMRQSRLRLFTGELS